MAQSHRRYPRSLSSQLKAACQEEKEETSRPTSRTGTPGGRPRQCLEKFFRESVFDRGSIVRFQAAQTGAILPQWGQVLQREEDQNHAPEVPLIGRSAERPDEGRLSPVRREKAVHPQRWDGGQAHRGDQRWPIVCLRFF